MHVPALLSDLVIVFALSIGVILLFYRLKLPAIVGFLITGIIVGPHGLGLFNDVHEVEILAEVGVILLLFTIGLEFSLKSLLQIKKIALIGGGIQVGLTILATMGIEMFSGATIQKALFLGFVISLSSTAIVLKLLQEKGDMDSAHGRNTLAILIFQDIIIIFMMLFTPLLGNSGGDLWTSVVTMLKGLFIAGLVIAGAGWVIPKVLYYIAKTANRELFLISTVVICFSIAFLTSSVGLSLSLGAFLAGLIISESDYSHHAAGHILPFRDAFTSLFFISIGMLLDINFFLANPFLIIGSTIGILLLKSFIATFANFSLGYPLRISLLSGFAISQIGEFSFILAKTGLNNKIIDNNTYQLILAVAILTMVVTPFIIVLSNKLSNIINRFNSPEWLFKKNLSVKQVTGNLHTKLEDHLIIVGFGITGENIARTAKAAGIPYIIIEMNPDNVKRAKSEGKSIFYGDATHPTTLEHSNCKEARVIVIGIPNFMETQRIICAIRGVNPTVHILARTRYLKQVNELHNLGANEVITEEFETSVELFTRVLMKYLVSQDQIEKFIAEIRSETYDMFRSISKQYPELQDLHLHLPNFEISTFCITEHSELINKTLAESELRQKYQLNILALRRGEHVFHHPNPDFIFQKGDHLILLGTPQKFLEIRDIL